MTISTVCWGSCSACVYPPQAAVGVNCAGNGNPGLVFTDEIDPTTGWSGDIGTGKRYGICPKLCRQWYHDVMAKSYEAVARYIKH